MTQIALNKMLEIAMETSELEDMVELKRSMLVFCLCMQDQGLTTPQDKMQTVLIKLHPQFQEKLLWAVQSTVQNILAREAFGQNVVNNDEEFAYSVEKFEFELFDHFRTHKVVKKYPINLPYSNSVVEMNYALAAYVE